MMRTGFASIDIFEGPAYHEMGEDGPQIVWDCFVQAVLADGTEYQHFKAFRSRYAAQRLLERVTVVGAIDLAHWTVLEPALSLEERWAMYADREQEVRWGMRSEDGMYDGIPYR